MKEPVVTVLMSCYNGASWLGEAIESVLAQTFRDFEFMIVDDGSSDATRDIISAYADKDKRITTLFKKNTGLADSLNAGLFRARGAWIARMDQDDICEPGRLAEQLAFAAERPGTVLLGSAFTEIGPDGRVLKTHYYPETHRALVRNLEGLMRFFPHSSAFFSAAIAKEAGGYNPRIHRAEDWRLWPELSTRGRLACINTPLVRIRKHGAQMSLDGNGRRQLCDTVLDLVCYFLKKAGHKDPSSQAYSEEEWRAFTAWVVGEVESSGLIEKRAAWVAARAEYVGGGLGGLARFAARLAGSGHAVSLVWHKYFGTPLPRQLAEKWARLRL